MGVISYDLAKAEVQKWLDELEVELSEDDASEASSIKTIANAIANGSLILNDDFSFTQRLKDPIGQEIIIKELKYKSRIKTGEIQNAVAGTKSQDIDGRFIGYISALTNQPKSIIKHMDSRDYKIGMSIAVFFM